LPGGPAWQQPDFRGKSLNLPRPLCPCKTRRKGAGSAISLQCSRKKTIRGMKVRKQPEKFAGIERNPLLREQRPAVQLFEIAAFR